MKNNPLQTMKDVCKEYGISVEELVGRNRRSHLIRARKEAAKRMLEDGLRVSDIAFYLQRKYHNITHYFKGLKS